MNRTTRARLLWWMAALTALHSTATVLVYYITGRFGPVFLAATLLVYVTIAALAVGLAATDEVRDPVAEARRLARIQAAMQERAAATPDPGRTA